MKSRDQIRSADLTDISDGTCHNNQLLRMIVQLSIKLEEKEEEKEKQFESRGNPIKTDVEREQSAPELNWPQSRDPISYRGIPQTPTLHPAELGLLALTLTSFVLILNYG
ncbi:hypothetical protein VN97_g7157 [Penicillium thymicola]|uniref:Uncharacterized protein n=1 Tax=Penicillium thymicola TaxID=293382 RepID=A0AAI9TG63_PENTH|nr:hypothetical protein VN97_g7157 [Penicillium thymicola]